MTLGQGHEDLETKSQPYHVGARFEALCEGVLMVASDFSCNFFRIPTSQCEQCVITTQWERFSMDSELFLEPIKDKNQLHEHINLIDRFQ